MLTDEQVQGFVLDALKAQKCTVGTAESCTSGLIAALLTKLPGSSGVFLGGVVAYDPRIKTDLLKVDPALISTHGVVSAPVAEAMARGAQEVLGVTYALASTGVAGPGGEEEAPVGTVWLALAGPGASVRSVCLRLTGDREQVRSKAAAQAVVELGRTLGLRD